MNEWWQQDSRIQPVLPSAGVFVVTDSKSHPIMWKQVLRVLVLGKPMFRRNNDLVCVRIKPCAPPTERTVGDNVMATQTHQMHVVVTLQTLIVINKVMMEIHF